MLTCNAASPYSFPPLPIPGNTPCSPLLPHPLRSSKTLHFCPLSLHAPHPSQAFPSQVTHPEPTCCLQVRILPEPSQFPCSSPSLELHDGHPAVNMRGRATAALGFWQRNPSSSSESRTLQDAFVGRMAQEKHARTSLASLVDCQGEASYGTAKTSYVI